MIRVTRHGKVLHIETDIGSISIHDEVLRSGNPSFETRILCYLADYLEKQQVGEVQGDALWWLQDAINTMAEGGNETHTKHLQALHDSLAAPVAAAPVVDPSRLGAAMTAFDDAGGHAVSYAPAWMRKALEAASTPAAPGIDLEQFRPLMQLGMTWGPGSKYRIAAESLADLIDASPKGDIDPLCAAKRPGCNYPACSCADASPKGGSDACIWTDDGEGNWATACGEIFTLIEGVPAENKVHHCPYCGKNLQATSAEVGA